MRPIAAVLIASALWICPVSAQTAGAKSAPAKFEVVTLKPSQAQGPNGGIRPAPGGERYVAQNCPLRLMITVAYGVKGSQITGGPGWIDTDRWDMNGKAEKPSTIHELREMLQDVLAEQFKLKFHKDTKEMPMYALRVDKGGTQLKPKEFANAGEPWVDVSTRAMLQMTLNARVVTMDYFAFRLSQLLDRPVRNFTGMPGNYDFELSYTRELPPGVSEGATFNGQTLDTSGPTIFEAVRRQLGLRLEPEKGPIETIVIDSVEKPSEN
jgi:uncharacterized protein (TIGR03435 family)